MVQFSPRYDMSRSVHFKIITKHATGVTLYELPNIMSPVKGNKGVNAHAITDQYQCYRFTRFHG